MYSASLAASASEAGSVMGNCLEASLLDALAQPQSMDQLASRFPAMSWSQIFLTIDRLSRAGFVSITRNGSGDYLVALNRAA